MKTFVFFLGIISILLVPFTIMAQDAPTEEKIAVLITGWGMSSNYNFEYAWRSHDYPRIGDRTEYEGQPCKIGHSGEFPYESHLNFIPFSILFETEGRELLFDSYGVYEYDSVNNLYLSSCPDAPSLSPDQIPQDIPIVPMGEVVSTIPLQPPNNHLETIPYEGAIAGGKNAAAVYIYNHVTEDWDPIAIETLNSAGKLVTFKTQVLGLFQVAAKACPVEQLYGQGSDQVKLLRNFRDRVLSTTGEGQALTELYYEWSPTIVKLMQEDGAFKKQIQGLIEGYLPLLTSLVQ